MNTDVLQKQKQKVCGHCVKEHQIGICPAYGTSYNKCGNMKHWHSVCRQARQPTRETGKMYTPYNKETMKNYRRILSSNLNSRVSAMTTNHAMRFLQRETDINVGQINQAKLKVKGDTGAQGNILLLRIYGQMYLHKIYDNGYPTKSELIPTSTDITAYNGTMIPQLGIYTLKCKYKGSPSISSFFVTDIQGPAIIGLPSSVKLQLVPLNCIISPRTK